MIRTDPDADDGMVSIRLSALDWAVVSAALQCLAEQCQEEPRLRGDALRIFGEVDLAVKKEIAKCLPGPQEVDIDA